MGNCRPEPKKTKDDKPETDGNQEKLTAAESNKNKEPVEDTPKSIEKILKEEIKMKIL